MKDAAERRRLSWIMTYRAPGVASAVCRRFGVSRPALLLGLSSITVPWDTLILSVMLTLILSVMLYIVVPVIIAQP
jgi:hypothetical protein